jgi:hypothetical protein
MKEDEQQPDKYEQAVQLEKENGKTAAEMSFAFGDELDKLVTRFHQEWDAPVSIIIGCLTFKAHAIMNQIERESRED